MLNVTCRNEIASVRPHSAVLPRSVRPARCGACFVVFFHRKKGCRLISIQVSIWFSEDFWHLTNESDFAVICLDNFPFDRGQGCWSIPSESLKIQKNLGSISCMYRKRDIPDVVILWEDLYLWNFALYTLWEKPSWPAVEAAGLGWGRLETWLESGQRIRDFRNRHWKRCFIGNAEVKWQIMIIY